MKKYEYEYNFQVTLGRAFRGVQKSMYKQSHILGLDINIIKIPSFLNITYRVTIQGDLNNIEKFIVWYNHNYAKKNTKGEQEEEMF